MTTLRVGVTTCAVASQPRGRHHAPLHARVAARAPASPTSRSIAWRAAARGGPLRRTRCQAESRDGGATTTPSPQLVGPLQDGELLTEAQRPARVKQLELLTVEKGLKPLLRLYGLATGGTKPALMGRIIIHEMGYPDKDEAQLTDAEMFNKLNLKKTSALLKGYSAWRTKLPTTVLDRSLKGVPFDVIALVNALSDMSEVSDTLYPNGATAGPLKQTWRNGKHDMDNTMVVRMQLEALARCVHDVYRRAPETMFAAGDAEERDARVDIDLAGGRLLVAYQTLAAGTGVVTAEHDDTAAALVALQSAEVLEPPQPPPFRRAPAPGQPELPQERPKRPRSAMSILSGMYMRNLRRLRREYDAAMEERVVEEHFGGKEGVVLRGTVTAVGGDRKKDAILQIMPGFVRAGLPEALQCYGDNPVVGQEMVVMLEQIAEGAAMVGRVPVLVSRNNRHFPAAMLRSLVPELQSNWGEANARVNLVAAAREPGAGTKIAVEGSDPSVNALGVCLGKGKWRIKKMQDDLGEPVSIVVMDRNDPVQNIINALLPGAVLPHQVTLDRENRSAYVVLPTGSSTLNASNISRAIGRGGINMRLASKVTGWHIDIEQPKDFTPPPKLGGRGRGGSSGGRGARGGGGREDDKRRPWEKAAAHGLVRGSGGRGRGDANGFRGGSREGLGGSREERGEARGGLDGRRGDSRQGGRGGSRGDRAPSPRSTSDRDAPKKQVREIRLDAKEASFTDASATAVPRP